MSKLGFEIGLVTLFFVAGVAYQHVRAYLTISDWILHSAEMTAAIDTLSNTLNAAESSQRGFLITGREDFLAEYHKAAREYPAQLARLERLAPESPDKSDPARVKALSARVQESFAIMIKTLELFRHQGPQSAFAQIAEGEGQRAMITVRERIQDMRMRQREIKERRVASVKKAARRTFSLIVGGFALSMICLILARVRMQKDMVALQIQGRELTNANNEAEKANRSKSEFVASLSHEIRTPMNSIVGMSTILSRSALDDSSREAVSLIQRSARTLLQLIQDLLDLSVIDAGRLKINQRPFRVRDALADVHGMIQAQGETKAALAWETDARLPETVVGDVGRVTQVLLNLAANAVKFTESGKIVIRAEPLRTSGPGTVTVRFSVRDTGRGISSEDQAKLFQPFTRLESTQEQTPGTGLGLSICRRLVDTMGGEIGVESRVGHGSTFWFHLTFPVVADVSALPKKVSNPILRSSTSLQKNAPMLVVDDNSVNLMVATRLLDSLGVPYKTAQSGEAALDLLKSGTYSAVLLDCQMPGFDGYQTAAEWRRYEAEINSGHLPILAMTANAQEEDRERSLRAGMDAHLTKPLDLSALAAALSPYVSIKETPPPTIVLAKPLDTSRSGPSRTTIARLDLAVITRMRGIRGVGATEDAAEAAVNAFETRLAGSLERMRRFAAASDVRTLSEEAAFLRASAHTVGAGSVIGLCRHVEAMAGGTKWSPEEAEIALGQLEAEGNDILKELRSWLRSQEINV